MSPHPKTQIFSFNLSLNAPWFVNLAFEKNTMYFTLVILQSSIEKTNHVQVIPICELLALTRWPHIFLYFSLTECQKSCSHPMTPHFLSLCSHRMPQSVGGRALHPYPLHIWLPPPGSFSNRRFENGGQCGRTYPSHIFRECPSRVWDDWNCNWMDLCHGYGGNLLHLY